MSVAAAPVRVATQFGRLLHLTNAPVPDDVLLPRAFQGVEEISRLFLFDVELLAEHFKADAIDPKALLGQPVTISAALTSDYRGGPRRPFNGIVRRFTHGEEDPRFVQYRMELVPWLWLLTLTSDCRIFQDLTVPEIVKQLFEEFRAEYPTLVSFRFALTGTYTKLDYCVQYRETDFDFVSRLLEQEGICWWFEHSEDAHTLVLTDTRNGHPPCPDQPAARYEPRGGYGERENTVTGFTLDRELRSDRWTMRDYHFQMPGRTLHVTRATDSAAGDRREVFDYPGRYAERFHKPEERLNKVGDEGDRLVGWRMQQTASSGLVGRGASYCWGFTPGYRFELEQHEELKGPWLLTSVIHQAVQCPDYVSNAEPDPTPYRNTFTCLPHEVQYRPPRVTPRPVIQGVQNAVVVGTPGKEIDVDVYGRIKVQFPWDRRGKHDANSSCWVRVAQSWAGKRWGVSFWPRIGQEVLVNFIEGDPDHPIVVGSVYNADQMPPYLGQGPDAKHQHDPNLTGIKTCSTPGGEGYNELRFDDSKENEQVFLHAQRDLDVRVRHSRHERIGNGHDVVVGWEKDGQHGGDWREVVHGHKHVNILGDQVRQVHRNSFVEIGDDKIQDKDRGWLNVTVHGQRHQTIKREDHLHVVEDRYVTVDRAQTFVVGMLGIESKGDDQLLVHGDQWQRIKGQHAAVYDRDHREEVKGNAETLVGGERRESVRGSYSLTVDRDRHEHVGAGFGLEAVQEIHLKAGMNVVMEAGAMLTIKGPGGFLSIGPDGVTIQGTLVKINCGGAAGEGAPVAPVPAGPVTFDLQLGRAVDAALQVPEPPEKADRSRPGYSSAPPKV